MGKIVGLCFVTYLSLTFYFGIGRICHQYETNGNLITICCIDHYFNTTVHQCLECPSGSFGIECRHECPTGYYGKNCRFKCNCNKNEWCHFGTGCKRKILSTETTESTSQECPSGSFGIECRHECPTGYNGKNCRFKCNCNKNEWCHFGTGCKRKILSTETTESTSQGQQKDSSMTWGIYVYCMIATVIVICVLFGIGILKYKLKHSADRQNDISL